MSDESEETAYVTLRDVKYVVTWRTENDMLALSVEDEQTGQRWHGDFSSTYVEEMTQKTGNFKKFAIFVKMLSSSLRQVARNLRALRTSLRFVVILTPR